MVKVCQDIIELEGEGGLQVDGLQKMCWKVVCVAEKLSLYRSHSLINHFPVKLNSYRNGVGKLIFLLKLKIINTYIFWNVKGILDIFMKRKWEIILTYKIKSK